MKKLLTAGSVLLMALSLAACGDSSSNNNSSSQSSTSKHAKSKTNPETMTFPQYIHTLDNGKDLFSSASRNDDQVVINVKSKAFKDTDKGFAKYMLSGISDNILKTAKNSNIKIKQIIFKKDKNTFAKWNNGKFTFIGDKLSSDNHSSSDKDSVDNFAKALTIQFGQDNAAVDAQVTGTKDKATVIVHGWPSWSHISINSNRFYEIQQKVISDVNSLAGKYGINDQNISYTWNNFDDQLMVKD